MEKRIYYHPVTKKLSLETNGDVCTEPSFSMSDPVEPPVYAGPDIEEEDPEPMF